MNSTKHDIIELNNEYLISRSFYETNPHSSSIYPTILNWIQPNLTSSNRTIQLDFLKNISFGSIVKSKNDFFLAGAISDSGKYLISVRKISNTGDSLWVKEYYPISNFNDAVSAKDNGCYILCTKKISGISTISLLKISENGEMEWMKDYVQSENSSAKEMLVTEGNIIITGSQYNSGNGKSKIRVIRTDLNGNELNSHYYESENENNTPIEILESKKAIFIVGKSSDYLFLNKFEK